jgi:hypothetical protein
MPVSQAARVSRIEVGLGPSRIIGRARLGLQDLYAEYGLSGCKLLEFVSS